MRRMRYPTMRGLFYFWNGFSVANGTGMLAASDATIIFSNFPRLSTGTSDVAAMLRAFDAAVAASGRLTPMQEVQYRIQRQWVAQGEVPQIEFLMFNKGTIEVAANASYITLFAGIMVCLSFITAVNVV